MQKEFNLMRIEDNKNNNNNKPTKKHDLLQFNDLL